MNRSSTGELADGYAQCRRIARGASTSFYGAFWLAPPGKRRAMHALYAFYRGADDLADGPGDVATRRQALARWRASLHRAMQGEYDSPPFRALADTCRRFDIPYETLSDAVDGVEMDLQPRRWETFEELTGYCDRVASAVGLALLRVWGFRDPEALDHARRLGWALQLTNILRDLREDARAGRVYLPQCDLRRFECHEASLQSREPTAALRDLVLFELQRAEGLYAHAADLEPLLLDGRRSFRAVVGVYRELLETIRRRDGDVFSRRVRLSLWQKLRVTARSFGARRP